MAREGETCELVRIMELMMQMRAEDTKAAQVREENRIQENLITEVEERERRQEDRKTSWKGGRAGS